MIIIKKLIVFIILIFLIIMFFCVPSIIENKNENVVTIQEKEVVDEDRVENINEEEIQKEEKIETKAEDDHFLKNVEDINLRDIDGKGTNYLFTYREDDFSAKFVKDTWHITDSYKIRNEKDLAIICQALIDIHPIPSSDGTSYRTVEDLVYEWKQHNIAYILLPEENSWKQSAKDVDLDPKDQGKNLQEMYESRTGKKLNIKDI